MISFRVFQNSLVIVNLLIASNSIGIANVDTKNTKILIAMGCFPNTVEVFILNKIIGLIKHGYDVELFAFSKPQNQIIQYQIEEYDLLSRVTYHTPSKSFLEKFDIILCEFGHIGIDFLSLKKEYNLKAKIITCFRGNDLYRCIQNSSDKYEDLFEFGDYFLPVCEYFKKILIDFGISPERIQVLYSGVDTSFFVPKEKKTPFIDKKKSIHIITVARLVTKKGHEYMIKALPSIIRKYPQIKYTIVGSGQLKRRLQRLVKKLKLKRYVTFVGSLTHHQIRKVLGKTDIFVLPSVEESGFEGIPNALKEAMLMNIPVISTYHAGIPELIQHEVSGLLVPEKNLQAIKDAIIRLIEDYNLRDNLSEAARKVIVENFDMKVVNNQLHEILMSL